MGKKSTASEKRAQEVSISSSSSNESGHNLFPSNILEPANSKPNSLSTSDVEVLVNSRILPPSTIFFVTHESEKADWTMPGWSCFYEYPFLNEASIPFSSFIKAFLTHLKVALCQLMPMVWRVLVSTDILAEKLGFELTLGDLAYTYAVKI